MRSKEELTAMLDELVGYVVSSTVVDLPKYRFDGEPVTTPEEVAAILGIPLSEAKARMANEEKDVYSSAAARASTRGVGTVVDRGGTVQRARRIAGILKRRRKKKRKRENEE